MKAEGRKEKAGGSRTEVEGSESSGIEVRGII